MISVLFFARIREQLGLERMAVDYSDTVSTLSALEEYLISQGGEHWEATLGADNVLRAVNQEVADADQPLSDGDEVAFFPPVTGG